MIDSLLEELSQQGVIEADQTASTSDVSSARPSEDSFLTAMPIVQRIAGRRRSQMNSTNASDLVQEIALRLWRWATNHREKSEGMSDDEWRAFAARTAYNEVCRSFSRERTAIANIDPDDVPTFETTAIEGQTGIEVFSLIRAVWQGICELSLRQRRSLLLHSQELIIYFLQSGISDEELAEVLEFKVAAWYDIRDRVPMTDVEIANTIECAGELVRPSPTVGSVKKARHEARVKLEGFMRK